VGFVITADDFVDPSEPHVAGEDLLDVIELFLDRFICYPREEARWAHVLWIAHCWFMSVWSTTGRLAFLSPEPGSGKSRALELTAVLVPRHVHTVNATANYVFRKISDPEGPPTLIFDEVDTIFGPRARGNEELRGLLNAGHRRGATVGRCKMRGDQVLTEELDCFAPVALAGLGNLPDTVLARSIIIEMRRRTPREKVEPWRERVSGQRAGFLYGALAEWSSSRSPNPAPELPDGLVDRAADVWEPLIAVADLAGGVWPSLARRAAIALKDVGRDRHEDVGVELLCDLRDIFGDRREMFTRDLIPRLLLLEESRWRDSVNGKALDSRQLARILKPYGITSRQLRIGTTVAKGYERAALQDAFDRYLPPIP
jgi:hypothetical protein